MLKRILKFNKRDWDHVRYLFTSMVISFLRGDLRDSREAYYFLRLHFSYNSKEIRKEEDTIE